MTFEDWCDIISREKFNLLATAKLISIFSYMADDEGLFIGPPMSKLDFELFILTQVLDNIKKENEIL